MAVSSRGSRAWPMARSSFDKDTSPERTKVWTEPKPKLTEQRVAVLYYLSRNGQLEQPHLMEVPVSSPQGELFLRDVMNRLNFLRGQGMANMYSWSAKRSYKSGFVWQDLSEKDFIYPCHGQEYILKGSLLPESTSLACQSHETTFSSSSRSLSEVLSSFTTGNNSDDAVYRKKNHSWSCSLKHEKTSIQESGTSANESVQTEHKSKRKGAGPAGSPEVVEESGCSNTMEVNGEVISLLSSSTSELKKLNMMKGSDQKAYWSTKIRHQMDQKDHSSGRMKLSAVLVQLIRCGSSRWE